MDLLLGKTKKEKEKGETERERKPLLTILEITDKTWHQFS